MASSSTIRSPPEGSSTLVGPPRAIQSKTLANGLRVVLDRTSKGAPLVTTALIYCAGTRDERPGQGGIAHFLEHMMFKGSERFGPGEIDRRTQRLGGSNNAFTSHDSTAYFFSFAADRWHEALVIESDRMAGLSLVPDEVESERRVVIEEIAMYDDDPWDALQLEVQKTRFGDHPYGAPVLGTVADLQATGAAELGAFHRDLYRPDNAVLAVVGDLGDPERALDAIDASFGALPEGAPERSPLSALAPCEDMKRVERRKGEVARLLLALPTPPARAAEHAAIRLLATVLGGSRGSRLHRRLVDEEELAVFAVCETSDFVGPGHLSIAAEVLPGVEPSRVEAEVLEMLTHLATGRRPIAEAELSRARRLALSDWAFGHERVEQQAITLGLETALFESGWNRRQLEAIEQVTPEELMSAAANVLDPEAGSVLGWSLPRASS